ncbi:MAG: preprotein translocase subunit SecG [Alphaproteobacteria bacterium]|nr:preprotein translocase subunit SecG [Alphaproteobacteria bacterium]MDA7989058.1 preprotein translocase subunit SecG [Alphaproteobacteria bacterium]
MQNVLLSLHLINTIALVVVILLQRSDGGALGIGGGGPGSMFSQRGQASFLTRTTALLAASFMVLSIALAFVSGAGGDVISVPGDVLDSGSGGEGTGDGGAVPAFPTLPDLPEVPQ